MAELTRLSAVLALCGLAATTNGELFEEEENPYKGDADATNECYTWAADGQCAGNPSYMLSSCKHASASQTRRRNTPA